MARKRRSGNDPKRAYLIEWRDGYEPHQVPAVRYKAWKQAGAIEEVEPRRARLCDGYKFLFHEDPTVGAVIVPVGIGPSIPSFWRIVERFALYDTRGQALTPHQIRLWIWQEYR